MDLLEERLTAAGRTVAEDPQVRAALDELVEASAPARRRPVAIGLGLGAVLAVAGVAAATATQWGPWWYVPEPDLVIAQDWYDESGAYLGSCESRTRYSADLDGGDEVMAFVKDWLDGHDLAAIEPDEEWLRIFRENAAPGGLYDGWAFRPNYTEARIRHEAKEMTVWRRLTEDLHAAGLDPEYLLTGSTQIQCTTDSVRYDPVTDSVDLQG